MSKTRFVLFLASMVLVASVHAGTYGLNPDKNIDSVFFRSTAKLEFIEGRTNGIDGSFTVDPANTSGDISGILRVDLRTLKTGIDTRDGHMRDRHLHTDKYPYAYFELTGLRGIPTELAAGSNQKGTVEGWFYIHGVKRKLEAPVEISRQTDASGKDVISVRTKFAIKLDEYGIPRPKALFLKVAETIEVECIFTGYNDLGGPTVELPGWAELK